MAKAKVGNEDRTSIIWEAPNGKTYSIPAEPKGKTGIDVRGDGHVQTMYREWMKNNPKDKPEKFKKVKKATIYANTVSRRDGKLYLLVNGVLDNVLPVIKNKGEMDPLWIEFYDAAVWHRNSPLIDLFKEVYTGIGGDVEIINNMFIR